MNQFFTWLAMGGYSSYVWSAYGLVGCVFMVNLLGVKHNKSHMQQKLQKWFKTNDSSSAT